MNARPTNSKRLMRLKEGAVYISLSRRKVRALVQRGEIPIVRDGEHSPWLLDVRDLDAWIDRHKETL